MSDYACLVAVPHGDLTRLTQTETRWNCRCRSPPGTDLSVMPSPTRSYHPNFIPIQLILPGFLLFSMAMLNLFEQPTGGKTDSVSNPLSNLIVVT